MSYRSIITLDIAILMTSAIAAIAMSRQIVVIYLLIIYAFAGFVDVLRALEAKKYGAPYWKPKFITGVIEVLFAIALLIIGMFIGDPVILYLEIHLHDISAKRVSDFAYSVSVFNNAYVARMFKMIHYFI